MERCSIFRRRREFVPRTSLYNSSWKESERDRIGKCRAGSIPPPRLRLRNPGENLKCKKREVDSRAWRDLPRSLQRYWDSRGPLPLRGSLGIFQSHRFGGSHDFDEQPSIPIPFPSPPLPPGGKTPISFLRLL